MRPTFEAVRRVENLRRWSGASTRPSALYEGQAGVSRTAIASNATIATASVPTTPYQARPRQKVPVRLSTIARAAASAPLNARAGRSTWWPRRFDGARPAASGAREGSGLGGASRSQRADAVCESLRPNSSKPKQSQTKPDQNRLWFFLDFFVRSCGFSKGYERSNQKCSSQVGSCTSSFKARAKRPQDGGRGVTRARSGGQLGSCGDWSWHGESEGLGRLVPDSATMEAQFSAAIQFSQYLAAPFPPADRRRRKRKQVYRQRGERQADDPFDRLKVRLGRARRRRRAAPP